MKKLILNYSIIAIPLVFVLILPFFILCISREFMHFDHIVKLQKSNKNILFDFVYNGESNVPYKKALIIENKPSIIIVGTSRTIQVRKEFFLNQDSFINASIPNNQMGNFMNINQFVNVLPDNGSGTLVFIGLDHSLFTKSDFVEDNSYEKSTLKRIFSLPGINIRRMYLDYLSGKFSVLDIWKKSRETHNIGFASIKVNDDGWRSDGSYSIGTSMRNPNKIQVTATAVQGRVDEIKRLDFSYINNAKVVNKNFADLQSFLEMCKKRNIEVVGFLVPDPKPIHEEMIKNNSLFKKEDRMMDQELLNEFTEQGFIIFDMSDISKFGGNESEFIDSVHGTDLLFAKLFVYMSNNNSHLSKIINKDFLDKAIKNTKTDFLAF